MTDPIDLIVSLPDGRKIGCAEYGKTSGNPVLYFHGGLSSRLDIAFAHQLCIDRNIRLLAPDRPGIGISDRKVGRTLLDRVEDMRHLLDTLDIKSLPVIGWSVGGPYAFAAASALGDRISRLVTVGSAPPLDYPDAVKELGLLIDRIILTAPDSLRPALSFFISVVGYVPRPLLKMQMLLEVGSKPDREIVKAMSVADATDFIVESVRQGGDGILDDYNALKLPWGFDLKDIKQNVQLWHGDQDALCPAAAQTFMAGLLPAATVVNVPQEGHFLLHKKISEVLDWLTA